MSEALSIGRDDGGVSTSTSLPVSTSDPLGTDEETTLLLSTPPAPMGFKRLVIPPQSTRYDKWSLQRYLRVVVDGGEVTLPRWKLRLGVGIGVTSAVLLFLPAVLPQYSGVVGVVLGCLYGATIFFGMRFGMRGSRSDFEEAIRDCFSVDELPGRLGCAAAVSDLYDEALLVARRSNTDIGRVLVEELEDTVNDIVWDVRSNLQILEAAEERREVHAADAAIYAAARRRFAWHHETARAVLEHTQEVVSAAQEAADDEERSAIRGEMLAHDSLRSLKEVQATPALRLSE